MSFRTKGIIVAALAGAALGTHPVNGGFTAHAETVDKAELGAAIEAYLKENPGIVYESLVAYQELEKKREKEKAQALIKQKQDDLHDTDITPAAGNPEGDITVVEFFDYNCGYCKRAFKQLADLIKEEPNVRVMFKEFPILGASSKTASEAAKAAFLLDKEKYFDVHALLMEKRLRKKEDILDELEKLGYDRDELDKKMQSDEVAEILRKNSVLARQIGISGTPAFIIGERFVPGAVDLNTMKAIIKEERAKEG